MAYMSRDDRRDAIIEAAIRVIMRDGFSQMTTRLVATEAEASTGIVHHHFSSTGELRNIAFARFIQRENERALALVNDLPPLERLRVFFLDMFEVYEQQHRIVQEAWGEAQRDPQLGAVWAESLTLSHRIMHDALQDYFTDAGQPVPDNLAQKTWRIVATGIGLGDMISPHIQLLPFTDARQLLMQTIEDTFQIHFFS